MIQPVQFSLITIAISAVCSLAPAQTTRRVTAPTRAVAAPRTVAPVYARTGARSVVAGGSASGLGTALHGFAADVGRMPTPSEGLNALIYPPPGVKNWRGPYISTNNWKKPFEDPWGNQYRYTATPAGRTYLYSITSDGPDRKPGTADDLSIQF